MDLYFYSNVFGSLTFVAILIAFRAIWSIRFFVFLSTVACTPFDLTFNLSLAISLILEFAPVFWRLQNLKVLWHLWFRFIVLSSDGYFVFRPQL